jgi:uncharacterized protein (DUF2147 family)
MGTTMKRFLITWLLAACGGAAWAQATPVGLWKTVDEETKAERSLVRISDNGGVLVGKVEKLLDPARQDVRCDLCTDARKGQPVLGMTIVEGVRKNDREPYWDGGSILDPAKGKSYKVRLTPKEEGKTLEVRGFIGFLYRNQTWIRVE